MIRFRFGINNLNNNKRYCGIIDTKCPWCDEIENEQHFLIRCPVYKELRKKYLYHSLTQKPERIACKQIMQDKNVKKIRALAMYIFYAFVLREEKLQEQKS